MNEIVKVPFYRLKLAAGEINAVRDVLRSGWLTTGEITRAFEKEFAAQVGAKHAVAVNSCTAALHLSLINAGVKAGHEVITTPYTFVATIEAILHVGAKPVLVDTEADSLNLDLDLAEKAITSRTRALIPVHVAGLPCDLRRIDSIRRHKGIVIVHDAAHALGASSSGLIVGATRDYSCFSFYATKNLTTGEGGMITTASSKAVDRLRMLSLHGMSRGAWRRYSGGGSWHYQIPELGYKYNISDIASALGLAQLRRFDRMQEKRRRLAKLYRHYLEEIEELELPVEPPDLRHAWHLYIVHLRPRYRRYRDQIVEDLKKRGVETSVHFIPIYLHQYYRHRLKFSRRRYPNSYNHYRSVITLPLFVDLRENEIAYIATCLKSILRSLEPKGN
jgi:dTDP-4-amino-4,6-dideoxygalactose transaminase